MSADTSTTTASAAEPSKADALSDLNRFPHFPALDGLRGLAVAAVLVFHGGFTWATGGYLGVSTFFTLSGFLITSLLLAEQERDGNIALGAFWVRRFKRLMPAAVVAIGLIFIFWNLLDKLTAGEANFTGTGVLDRLNGDLLAALVYVANWRFAFPPEGAGYENLFDEGGDASPAAHFWSLSVEEQFYVFFPLIAMMLLSRMNLSKKAFGIVLAVALAASAATPFFLEGFDRIYNGTDVRAAEILIGALMAVGFASKKGRQAITSSPAIMGLGAIGLVLSFISWVVFDLATPLLLNGGLLIYGVITGALIYASTQSTGPVVAFLSLRPLRWLGAISYGAYLYHWPIFRWVDEDSTGLSIWPLFVVRMALTFAFAWVSYHYLEDPIRRGTRPGLKVASPLLAVGASAFFLVGMGVAYSDIGRDVEPEFEFEESADVTTVTVPKTTVAPNVEDDPGDDPGEAETGTTVPATTTTAPPTLAEPEPVLAVVGDSVAFDLFNGLSRRAEALDLSAVGNATFGGCGLAFGGEAQWFDAIRPACRQDNESAQGAVDSAGAQAIVFAGAPVDLLPRRFDPDDEFDVPTNDSFVERVENDYRSMTEHFLDQDVAVVWMTIPCIEPTKAEELGILPTAVERVNEAIRRVVDEGGPGVRLFDLYEEVCDNGEFTQDVRDDPEAREDGLHFSEFVNNSLAQDVAREAHIAREFLDR